MKWSCPLGILVLLAFVLPLSRGHAEWEPDGNPVSIEFDAQIGVNALADLIGGAFIAWSDNRSGDQDIYAQRVDESGTMIWEPNGLAICTRAERQTGVSLARSGGGVIIAWADQRNGGGTYDIYAQKVGSVGHPAWTIDGVPVSTAAFDQNAPSTVSDGADGAILAWTVRRTGTDLDIYAQRVNLAGETLWAQDGIPVGVTSETQTDVRIIEDGAGGAIVAWRDYRDAAGDGEILAQRLAPDGTPMWEPNGLVVSNGARMLGGVTYAITTDGASGCFLAWHDTRIGAPGIYCQRVLGTGVAAWPEDLALTLLPFSQSSAPTIVPDGSDGAIAAWQDFRNGGSDIFAQRVNASGGVEWPANGVAVVETTGTQAFFASVSDPAGAIVAFRDDRNGNPGVYAQLVDHAGNRLWGQQGIPMCTAPGPQGSIVAAPGQPGGAIVAWVDYRSGDGDIYASAAGLEVVGVDGEAVTGKALVVYPSAPNPHGASTTMRFFLARASDVLIEVFDPVGRRVLHSEWPGLGVGLHSIPFVPGRHDETGPATGVYLYRVRAGEDIGRGRFLMLR
jgi:hypothetical protein